MEPSVTSYLCLAVGAALLVLSAWERTGAGRNARAWTRSATETGVRVALFVLPGIGMLALALGLAPWADSTLGGLVLLMLVVAGLTCLFGWGVMRLPYPRWTVPGWARPTIARRFGKRRWVP